MGRIHHALRASLTARLTVQRIRSLLFGSGEQGVLYVPRPIVDGSQVLYQDAAGTTPVTADGDPVGLMLDLSGNDNHASQSTSAARPVYRTDGVLHKLAFDGVDDKLLTQDLAFLSGTSTSHIFVAGRLIERLINAGLFTVAAGSTVNRSQRSLADSGESPAEMKVDVRSGGHPFTANALEKGSYEALFEAGANIGGGVDLASYTETDRVHDTSNGIMTIGVGLAKNTPNECYGLIAVDDRLSGSSREKAIRYNASLAGVTL